MYINSPYSKNVNWKDRTEEEKQRLIQLAQALSETNPELMSLADTRQKLTQQRNIDPLALSSQLASSNDANGQALNIANQQASLGARIKRYGKFVAPGAGEAIGGTLAGTMIGDIAGGEGASGLLQGDSALSNIGNSMINNTKAGKLMGALNGTGEMPNSVGVPEATKPQSQINVNQVPTTEKKGIFDNILSGMGDVAMTAFAGTKIGQGIMDYDRLKMSKQQFKDDKEQRDFDNEMAVFQQLNDTSPQDAGKFMAEKLLPKVKASPELLENYKQNVESGNIGFSRRSLPAEWAYMTADERREYIKRYSLGGRAFTAEPWYNNILFGNIPQNTPPNVPSQEVPTATPSTSKQDVAEMAAGLRPKKQNPSPTERQRLSDAEYSREAMKNIASLYDDSFVGYPGKELFSKAQGYFGKTTKQQEEFLASTASMRNQVIKQITGAQMSRQEASRIMKQIPSPDDPPIRWKAKYDQTIKNIDMLEQKQLEIMGKGGVETSGYTESKPQSFSPQYQKGETIDKGGKKYIVVGYDTDGEPLVEEIK